MQVLQQVAEKQRLALLVQAQHGVQLGFGLGGHQRAQKAYIGRGHGHVHHEIRPREIEQPLDVIVLVQHRVDEHMPAGVAQQRQREGLHLAVIDDPADQVGTLVAEKE